MTQKTLANDEEKFIFLSIYRFANQDLVPKFLSAASLFGEFTPVTGRRLRKDWSNSIGSRK
ncbi:hypothetical protein [Labrenzia sp. DG1229]|uniref:hypothetical protein n=1 Tax=Labrenzia sp. DG1229 TaxID=681847 RepID=UPI00048F8E74|nr:hypothetical protein [Labrenzia sp. DG1229]